jgi:outer membrane protein OmpA-like peptidoglycan-associated protein/tetratricopeptide (TPR) repeat protein
MKQPLLLSILASFIILFPLFPQDANQKLKDIFLDAEYFFLNEDYQEALYSFNVLYKRGYADDAKINYRIGQCYLNISGEKGKSIPYLEKAVLNINKNYVEGSFKETAAPIDAYFFLGNAYRVNNQIDKAIASYDKYKTLIDSNNTMGFKLADNEISACKLALVMMKSPQDVKEINLGRPVNTSARDFFPVVSGDESVLLYNSAQKFYNAVFFSKKVNNRWSSPVNITSEIQSDGNQYCSSLSFYGTELYLRVEDNFDADLMVAKYENGIWTKSKSLGKNINTKFWEGNACVSKDGKTLFFSSNKPGGFGALDIYKSLRQPNGDWGIPVNLGNVINSEFNDDAPFITEDGKRLYFVSQGHQTMGGYDIFYSELDNIGKWMEPVNLGYPINTTDDELFFCPVKNGAVAYVGKYSKTGYGYEDIVRMQLVPEELIAAKPSKEEPKNQDKNTKQNEPSTDLAVNKLPSNFEKNLIETDSTTKAKERIVIRCIFFDFNSSALTIKAKKELDYLFIIMKNTPELKLEFSGNTDALGSDEYNLSLSAQRANNAKTYLINKGVQAERISTKGVGKKNYIAVNNNPDGSDNPEGRVFNRRVDFRIPEAINKSIIIEEVKVPEKLQIRNGESNP